MVHVPVCVCVREASVVSFRGLKELFFVVFFFGGVDKKMWLNSAGPLLFSQPPTAALPTQASRGRGCLEEEHINTLLHVHLSVYVVC